MDGKKITLKGMRIFLALMALSMFFPIMTEGSVDIEVADFGDVAVGSSSTMILKITNISEELLILNFDYETFSCNFSLPLRDTFIQSGETLNIEINWMPFELGTCTDTLHVIYGTDWYPKFGIK